MNNKDKKDFNRILKNADPGDLNVMRDAINGKTAHMCNLRVCTRDDIEA